LLLITISGCKNDSESVMSEMIDKQKDMLKILKGVTDKDSAAAAKSKLEALNKEAVEAMSKFDKKKLNSEELKKASEKYKAEEEATTNAIREEMQRIAKIPGAIHALGGGLMGGGFNW
jgi:uncharacterized protein YlxW (UPF0749 family)